MKTSLTAVGCGILIAGMLSSPAAFAQGHHHGERLKQADTNADGKVSWEEAHKAMPRMTEAMFNRLDRNSDGYLSREDRRAAPHHERQAGAHQLFRKADTNKDGKVSYDELHAIAPKVKQKRFAKLDRNGDGFITADELPKEGAGPQRLIAALKKADKNGDKKVTFDELHVVLPKLTEARFARLDRDSDGVITGADLRALKKAGRRGGTMVKPRTTKWWH